MDKTHSWNKICLFLKSLGKCNFLYQIQILTPPTELSFNNIRLRTTTFIKGVSSISTQLRFQFLIALSKKTRFAIKNQMEKIRWGHLKIYKVSKVEYIIFLLDVKKISPPKKTAPGHLHTVVFWYEISQKCSVSNPNSFSNFK